MKKLTFEEVPAYLESIQPGERVQETDGCMSGRQGTVYMSTHDGRPCKCVKWNKLPGEDGQMSTSITGGSRRLSDLLEEEKNRVPTPFASHGLPPQAEVLIGIVASAESARYRMVWKGSKIPRGATVGGVKIAWTQHGMITGEKGERLGYYDRVKEFSGQNKDEHEITVHVSAPPRNPDGSPCELVGGIL